MFELEHCKGALGKTKGVEGLGSCLHSKGDKGPFTLYAKVRFNEAKKKFFTRFEKMRVRQGESKAIDSLSVEGERCEAMAVVCFESIHLSSTHATLQVKVDEVAMNFDAVEEESLLPEVEVEEEFTDEW